MSAWRSLIEQALVFVAHGRHAAQPLKPESDPDRARSSSGRKTRNRQDAQADALRLFLLAGDRHQSAQAYLEAARLQDAAGNHAAAFETVRRPARSAPNSEEVLSAFAQVALATKQPLPAASHAAVADANLPDRRAVSLPARRRAAGMGDLPGASTRWRAERLEPDRAMTLLALGLVLNNRNQFAEAKAVLSRCLELEPDNIEARRRWPKRKRARQPRRRGAHAQRVLTRRPRQRDRQLVLGWSCWNRRDYAEARDALLKAVAAEPDSPKAHYQLSLVYARLGDEANAKKHLEIYQEKLRGDEERIEILPSGRRRTA